MVDKTIAQQTAMGAAAAVDDRIPIWDLSADEYKYVTVANLRGGVLTGGGTIATGGFTLTVPATGTAVTLTATQTLTNKALSGVSELSLKFGAETIVSGVIQPTSSVLRVVSETGTADNLVSIGVSPWEIIWIHPSPGHTITVKDATGNINLPSGDIVLSNQRQGLLMMYHDGVAEWILLATAAGY